MVKNRNFQISETLTIVSPGDGFCHVRSLFIAVLSTPSDRRRYNFNSAQSDSSCPRLILNPLRSNNRRIEPFTFRKEAVIF